MCFSWQFQGKKKKKTLMRALFIKTPIKHHKKLDKPIHGFKKPKELF